MGSREYFYDKKNTDKKSFHGFFTQLCNCRRRSFFIILTFLLFGSHAFLSLAAASIIRLCLLLSHIRRTFHGFFRSSSSSSSSTNQTPYTNVKNTHFRPHPSINPQICPNSSVLIQPNSLIDPIRPNMSSDRSINQDLEANNVRRQ